MSHSSEKLPTKEICIPIHHFTRPNDREWAIINHPAFQRLGFFYELGQTHLVYPGAVHKRKEHVLGALHVAHKIIDAVNRNHSRYWQREEEQKRGQLCVPISDTRQEWEWGDKLSVVEKAIIRLSALLHDIGHLPMGHTLEDEVELIENKHDGKVRIWQVFRMCIWDGEEYPCLEKLINDNYGDLVPSYYIEEAAHNERKDGSAADLVFRIIRCSSEDEEAKSRGERPHSRKILGEGDKLLRIGVCRDIVGDTICADLLDYLQRDWHHIGKSRLMDKRLYQYMELRQRREPPRNKKEMEGLSESECKTPSFVISLGMRPKLKSDAITSIMALLGYRYELYEYVILHPTKLAATSMLARVIQEIAEYKKPWDNLEADLLLCSDEQALDYLKEQVKGIQDDSPKIASLKKSLMLLLHGLKWRRLHKLLYLRRLDELAPDVADRLIRWYKKPSNRLAAARILEKDFGLKEGSITLYCPPSKGMSAKIPGVNIYLDGDVARFKDWEDRTNISDGQVKALGERFRRLWRIAFFINSDEGSGKRDIICQAIQQLVLGDVPYSEDGYWPPSNTRPGCLQGSAIQMRRKSPKLTS